MVLVVALRIVVFLVAVHLIGTAGVAAPQPLGQGLTERQNPAQSRTAMANMHFAAPSAKPACPSKRAWTASRGMASSLVARKTAINVPSVTTREA